MQLSWKRYTAADLEIASGERYCIYVFHHPMDGDRPFYIGKAKFFGTKQADGYKGTARYNGGYSYLLEGMLRAGYSLYISQIGPDSFADVEAYEQELIARWNPVRAQRIKDRRLDVITDKPWLAPNNSVRSFPSTRDA